MKPTRRHKEDAVPTEALLLLTLALLLGATLNQGLFREYMEQAAAMAALCLLHVALVGRVSDLSKALVLALRGIKRVWITRRNGTGGIATRRDDSLCLKIAAFEQLELDFLTGERSEVEVERTGPEICNWEPPWPGNAGVTRQLSRF